MKLRIKAAAVVLLLAGVTCAAQETRGDSSCPIAVAVAGTDVPLQSGESVVLWFSNRSSKTVSQVQFDVSFVSSTNRYPSSTNYTFSNEVPPGSSGWVGDRAAEAGRQSSVWQDVRGLEAQPVSVLFSDGSRWQASGSTCKRIFLNRDYIDSMRRWNKELRLEWNRTHPTDPMPSAAMAALLEQNDAR